MKKPTLDDLIGAEFVGTEGSEYEGKRVRLALDPVTGRLVGYVFEQRQLTAAEFALLKEHAVEVTAEDFDGKPLPTTRQDTEDEIDLCARVIHTAGRDDPDIRAAYRKRLIALRRHLTSFPPSATGESPRR